MNIFQPYILRHDQWVFLASLDGTAQWAMRRVRPHLILLALFILAVAVIVPIDYVILFEVFTFLLEGAPGEAVHWSAWIMALSGLVAVIAFHALSHRHRSERFDRGISLLARFFLAAFIIGVGLMLAGIVYVNGAGSLAGISLINAVQAFIGETIEASQPTSIDIFESVVLPQLPVLFAIGLGGIFVLSVYTAHILIGGIHHLFATISDARATALASARGLACLREHESRYVALVQAYDARRGVPMHERHLQFITAIVAAGYKGLVLGEKLLASRQLNPTPGEADIIINEAQGIPRVLSKLDLPELERRVIALRQALTIEHVLSVVQKHTTEK